MPEKERARLKEKYIKEFRERKQIQHTLKAASKRQAVNRALGSMVDALEDAANPLDEFTARLNTETALNEARMDIALEQKAPTEKCAAPVENSTQATASPPAKTIGRQLKSDASEKDL
ncbi:MAG: hypothetical protein OXE92_08110 [Bacteroidetes bacterium]|nr:hypothetical protein [Bacteroidota bacterium]MCY4205671.1 hypothetical protein [Bacteroidota bacterium]